MSLDIILRKFAEEDAADLIALSIERQPGATIEEIEEMRKYLCDFHQNPSSTTYFVAEKNGKLIGYIMGMPMKDFEKEDPLLEKVHDPEVTYYCQDVFVTETERRKGVSKMLYRVIMNYALEEGYKEIAAVVTKDNEPSIMLHRSFGMTEESIDRSIIFKLQLS
jgi:predicted GNAT superfamily acetyltransferase